MGRFCAMRSIYRFCQYLDRYVSSKLLYVGGKGLSLKIVMCLWDRKNKFDLSSIDQIKLITLISLNVIIWFISYYNLDVSPMLGLEIFWWKFLSDAATHKSQSCNLLNYRFWRWYFCEFGKTFKNISIFQRFTFLYNISMWLVLTAAGCSSTTLLKCGVH